MGPKVDAGTKSVGQSTFAQFCRVSQSSMNERMLADDD
jgi:hypothetical protein